MVTLTYNTLRNQVEMFSVIVWVKGRHPEEQRTGDSYLLYFWNLKCISDTVSQLREYEPFDRIYLTPFRTGRLQISFDFKANKNRAICQKTSSYWSHKSDTARALAWYDQGAKLDRKVTTASSGGTWPALGRKGESPWPQSLIRQRRLSLHRP